MTDLDPEIWNNKTLGAATNLPFLDEVTAQISENRAAKVEGREPENKELRGRYTNETTNLYMVDSNTEVVEATTHIHELEYNEEQVEKRIEEETNSSLALQEDVETHEKIPMPVIEEKTTIRSRANKK